MAQTILDLLRSALVQYGYWALALTLLLENAGIPVPGETILLLASFLAYSQHSLSLAWIMVVATLAATVGDNLGFALGYYGGRRLLERYQSVFRIPQKTIARGEALFERFGAATIFFARFVFGMRVIAGPMAGVLRMPWKTFAIFNFLGAAVWVTVIAGVGYFFGRHWWRVERILKRVDIAIVVLALVGLGFWWWRNRGRESSGG